jgi:hypothetical protein
VDVTRDLGAIRDSPLSVPPKVLEAIGRHFGVPDRVPEVVLESPRVVAIVGEALDEAVATDGADWSAAPRSADFPCIALAHTL